MKSALSELAASALAALFIGGLAIGWAVWLAWGTSAAGIFVVSAWPVAAAERGE
jgi:hypothetical protein